MPCTELEKQAVPGPTSKAMHQRASIAQDIGRLLYWQIEFFAL